MREGISHGSGAEMAKQKSKDVLAKLMKHWQRANPTQRAEFLAAIGEPRDAEQQTLSAIPDDLRIADGRYLLVGTIKRIEHIMIRRQLRPAEVAAEAGFPEEGMRLMKALVKRGCLRLAFLAALAEWLRKNEADL